MFHAGTHADPQFHLIQQVTGPGAPSDNVNLLRKTSSREAESHPTARKVCVKTKIITACFSFFFFT